jgi:hypothetical protein
MIQMPSGPDQVSVDDELLPTDSPSRRWPKASLVLVKNFVLSLEDQFSPWLRVFADVCVVEVFVLWFSLTLRPKVAVQEENRGGGPSGNLSPTIARS